MSDLLNTKLFYSTEILTFNSSLSWWLSLDDLDIIIYIPLNNSGIRRVFYKNIITYTYTHTHSIYLPTYLKVSPPIWWYYSPKYIWLPRLFKSLKRGVLELLAVIHELFQTHVSLLLKKLIHFTQTTVQLLLGINRYISIQF